MVQASIGDDSDFHPRVCFCEIGHGHVLSQREKAYLDHRELDSKDNLRLLTTAFLRWAALLMHEGRERF